MTIEKEPLSGIATFAIPNDPAIYEEDIGQLDFFSMSPELANDGENDEY